MKIEATIVNDFSNLARELVGAHNQISGIRIMYWTEATWNHLFTLSRMYKKFKADVEKIRACDLLIFKVTEWRAKLINAGNEHEVATLIEVFNVQKIGEIIADAEQNKTDSGIILNKITGVVSGWQI